MVTADLNELVGLLRDRAMLRSVAGSMEGVSVSGVQFDSREVAPGDLFVAVTGAERDGHEFCAMAVERGAAALIVERPLPAIGVPQLVAPRPHELPAHRYRPSSMTSEQPRMGAPARRPYSVTDPSALTTPSSSVSTPIDASRLHRS